MKKGIDKGNHMVKVEKSSTHKLLDMLKDKSNTTKYIHNQQLRNIQNHQMENMIPKTVTVKVGEYICRFLYKHLKVRDQQRITVKYKDIDGQRKTSGNHKPKFPDGYKHKKEKKKSKHNLKIVINYKRTRQNKGTKTSIKNNPQTMNKIVKDTQVST